jgi:hypothetical protein
MLTDGSWQSVSLIYMLPHINSLMPIFDLQKNSQWRWADPGSKPKTVPACQYIESGLTDTEKKLRGAKESGQLSSDDLQRIFKYIFRCYAHIYYKHYNQLRDASNDDTPSTTTGSRQRLNTSFKHLAMYLLEWSILVCLQISPLYFHSCTNDGFIIIGWLTK